MASPSFGTRNAAKTTKPSPTTEDPNSSQTDCQDMKRILELLRQRKDDLKISLNQPTTLMTTFEF